MSVIRHITMIFLTAIGIVITLAVSLLLLNRQLPLKIARTMWSPLILKICGIQMTVNGLKYIDKENACIFVSNHSSFIDIPCLFYSIPSNLHFIAKESLKKIPFLGWFMIATGMIFVDRTNSKKAVISLKKAAKLINKDRNVLVFPEGSRSEDGIVKSFKKGAFHLAIQSGAVLIPVGIKGTNKVWSKNSYKITPHPVRLQIGEGIPTTGLKESDIVELVRKVRQEVILLSS